MRIWLLVFTIWTNCTDEFLLACRRLCWETSLAAVHRGGKMFWICADCVNHDSTALSSRHEDQLLCTGSRCAATVGSVAHTEGVGVVVVRVNGSRVWTVKIFLRHCFTAAAVLNLDSNKGISCLVPSGAAVQANIRDASTKLGAFKHSYWHIINPLQPSIKVL